MMRALYDKRFKHKASGPWHLVAGNCELETVPASDQTPETRSKSRRWSPFAEGCFAGGIFGDMLFELFAPQGLKCPAAAVQRVDFGEIGKFAQQITKSNFTGGHTCVFRHFSLLRNPKLSYPTLTNSPTMILKLIASI